MHLGSWVLILIFNKLQMCLRHTIFYQLIQPKINFVPHVFVPHVPLLLLRISEKNENHQFLVYLLDKHNKCVM